LAIFFDSLTAAQIAPLAIRKCIYPPALELWRTGRLLTGRHREERCN
jgi:hypothetical protein